MFQTAFTPTALACAALTFVACAQNAPHAPPPAAHVAATKMAAAQPSTIARLPAAAHDFDFLVGTWKVHHRRLATRHVGGERWDEFTGFASTRLVLGGLGNTDEIRFPTEGSVGMTLRILDPQTNTWSVWWADNRDGRLQTPVKGRFANGIGEFYARTSKRAGRSACATGGQRSPRTARVGIRRSPSTAARPGRPVGS